MRHDKKRKQHELSSAIDVEVDSSDRFAKRGSGSDRPHAELARAKRMGTISRGLVQKFFKIKAQGEELFAHKNEFTGDQRLIEEGVSVTFFKDFKDTVRTVELVPASDSEAKSGAYSPPQRAAKKEDKKKPAKRRCRICLKKVHDLANHQASVRCKQASGSWGQASR